MEFIAYVLEHEMNKIIAMIFSFLAMITIVEGDDL